jgi:hypothetical protein
VGRGSCGDKRAVSSPVLSVLSLSDGVAFIVFILDLTLMSRSATLAHKLLGNRMHQEFIGNPRFIVPLLRTTVAADNRAPRPRRARGSELDVKLTIVQ